MHRALAPSARPSRVPAIAARHVRVFGFIPRGASNRYRARSGILPIKPLRCKWFCLAGVRTVRPTGFDCFRRNKKGWGGFRNANPGEFGGHGLLLLFCFEMSPSNGILLLSLCWPFFLQVNCVFSVALCHRAGCTSLLCSELTSGFLAPFAKPHVKPDVDTPCS